MTPLRISLFLVVALSVWTVMHGYVFWRLASVPWVAEYLPRRTLLWAAGALAVSYPLARLLNSRQLEIVGEPLEFLAANWIGILFLLVTALLATCPP